AIKSYRCCFVSSRICNAESRLESKSIQPNQKKDCLADSHSKMQVCRQVDALLNYD
ncbi:MAG: hypothetical protein ACI845_004090, partial [Gammaproteobacteria bacterium]